MLAPVIPLALTFALTATPPDVLEPGVAAPGHVDGEHSGAIPPLPPAAYRYLDGGRARVLVETGAPREDGLRPTQVHELDTGRVWTAYIGRSALVRVRALEDADAVLARLGLRDAAAPVMPSIGLYRVDDPAGDGAALAQRLAPHVGDALVEAVPDLHIPVRLHDMPVPPDDPRYPGQWYLEKIGVEDAWAYSTGSPDVTVLVADNGCDLDHPDLQAKLDPGVDVVDRDGSPDHQPGLSGNEHGTACAGIIGAAADNGTGIAGTCPECRLRCARMLSLSDEPVSLSDLASVFQFALEADADVVSNSWGFVEAIAVPQVLADAIAAFYAEGRDGRGGIVVFAAGNDGRELGDDELLAVPGVIGVGAVTNFDELTSFTNYGASLDLVAPTGTVTTDIAGADGDDEGDYTSRFGGTSSACPVVAGVAALALSAAPELTADELAALLVDTARPAPFATPDESGHDPHFGYGVIAPAAALREALGIEEHVDGGPGQPPNETPVGCGCDGGTGAAPALALLPLLAIARRRRRAA